MTKRITSIKEMQQLTSELKAQGKTIGFVPTMGALHDGHITLLKQAQQENDIAVASVFVNPLQFGPNEDYADYPRQIDEDEALLTKHAIDYLFYPGKMRCTHRYP